jgi:hypothetical protein
MLGVTTITTQALVIETGTYFESGNENYTVALPMNFSIIKINSTWIRFNTTDFNLTAPNNIWITLSYMSNNMSDYISGNTLLTFTASTSSGNVLFNLSGFIPNGDYDIYKSNILFDRTTATANGNILFSNNAWSEKTFRIKNHSTPVNQQAEYITLNIMPILIAIVLMIILFTMLFTGTLTIESFITWLIIFIMAIVLILILIN